jgi:hypothetical protein
MARARLPVHHRRRRHRIAGPSTRCRPAATTAASSSQSRVRQDLAETLSHYRLLERVESMTATNPPSRPRRRAHLDTQLPKSGGCGGRSPSRNVASATASASPSVRLATKSRSPTGTQSHHVTRTASTDPARRHGVERSPTSTHGFDLAGSPSLVEEGLEWAVEAQDGEPAPGGVGLDPVAGSDVLGLGG